MIDFEREVSYNEYIPPTGGDNKKNSKLYNKIYGRGIFMLVTIATQEEFTEKVLQSSQPVLVDFWAQWCGPCKMVAPELDAVASQYEGKAFVAKVNVDELPKIAGQYNVSGIPTMLVIKNGKEVNRIVGFRPRKDIGVILDGHL